MRVSIYPGTDKQIIGFGHTLGDDTLWIAQLRLADNDADWKLSLHPYELQVGPMGDPWIYAFGSKTAKVVIHRAGFEIISPIPDALFYQLDVRNNKPETKDITTAEIVCTIYKENGSFPERNPDVILASSKKVIVAWEAKGQARHRAGIKLTWI